MQTVTTSVWNAGDFPDSLKPGKDRPAVLTAI